MISPTKWLYYTTTVEREEAGTIPGDRRSGSLERGPRPGPKYATQVFSFSQYCNYLSTVQITFSGRTQITLQMKVRLSDLA